MSKKLSSTMMPSRSGNADYQELHKLDDVTKYNVSVFNVSFYKNSPNRSGTPLPINPNLTPMRKKKVKSPFQVHLAEITKKAPFVERIYRQALNFKPRNLTAGFPLIRHAIKTNTAVYNDYHIRETNAGYARNSHGGFYTK